MSSEKQSAGGLKVKTLSRTPRDLGSSPSWHLKLFLLYLVASRENYLFNKILLKYANILLNRTLVLLEDKLSSTTVDFIRSEGKLKTKCLY